MNMFEEALALEGMISMCKVTQGEMARRLGVSQSYVANKLRLLKFTDEERSAIISASLTERHARALLRLGNGEKRAGAIEKIRADGLNVAETEALVDFLHDGEAPERIGRACKLSRIDAFKSTLGDSVKTLTALGIDASQSINYYGTKTYITVCIDEG